MIHFRPIIKRRIKADTRALSENYADTHRRLRAEIEEQRISRLQSEGKIARHFKASRQFHQTGETA